MLVDSPHATLKDGEIAFHSVDMDFWVVGPNILSRRVVDDVVIGKVLL
jgi:hypothetical protein